ncbi:unnamed protein product [Protopolystoma xenopodis]|uniref:Uncharacterized protein n=1 Tax=Protopolystoma xenopodis TaxID=117903 RepID=A0A3S5B6L5_9PLAT|nr:unnamed protein product [Protopolystoma xenopodis]
MSSEALVSAVPPKQCLFRSSISRPSSSPCRPRKLMAECHWIIGLSLLSHYRYKPATRYHISLGRYLWVRLSFSYHPSNDTLSLWHSNRHESAFNICNLAHLVPLVAIPFLSAPSTCSANCLLHTRPACVCVSVCLGGYHRNLLAIRVSAYDCDLVTRSDAANCLVNLITSHWVATFIGRSLIRLSVRLTPKPDDYRGYNLPLDLFPH